MSDDWGPLIWRSVSWLRIQWPRIILLTFCFLKKGFLRVIIYGVGVESSFQLDSSLSLEEEVKDF